jgi:phosphate acetyltransferase
VVARSIYLTSAEGNTGKSTIALGLVTTLTRTTARVGVFRPIARSTDEPDYVLELLLTAATAEIAYEDCIGVTYDDVHDDPDAALSRIVERFKHVEAACDAVVIVGSDYTDVGSPTELSYNARIAANLGAPVLLALGGRLSAGAGERLGQSEPRTPEDLTELAEIAVPELRREHASLLAVIVNRADPDTIAEVTDAVSAVLARSDVDEATAAPAASVPVWTIPEDPVLVAPTMRAVMQATDATLVKGDAELLAREALGVVVAAMSMNNVLTRLTEGAVVIVPGDRTEVLLAVVMANASGTFPSLAGIIVNGGFELPEQVERLLDGVHSNLPIVQTDLTTYETAVRITHTRGRLAAESSRKYDTALALFEKHIDEDALVRLLELGGSTAVTPLMFEYRLIERARAQRRRIVLPEGDDDRILRAAATVLARGIADITILGEPFEVRSRAIELGLDINDADVISPYDDVLRFKFANTYAQLRAHKGKSAPTIERARDTVSDASYFGTMMVHAGLADGMVSGAAHTTAHTVRPAFEIIKTRPEVSVVSSVFFMALADRVLVYGDCAVIPEPTEEQLADIAISSAATAAQFGIQPRIAMLSYSTGSSGTGADVEKVRTATELVRQRRPDLPVDGPIQYDAAADAAVGAAKAPGSEVAGRASVFVFPDLNTGNNTYKAVQRSAGAVAIGPVLQGLNKPINDLSRGATVQDIVNTIAITAIQAAR